MKSLYRAAFCLFVLASTTSLFAVEPATTCAVTPIAQSKGENYFTPEQEVYLGEILAEWNGDTGRIVDDPVLNAYLKKIGDRLVKQLPPSNLNFRFYVYESPIANAYSIGGGRVYVTRKLIGFTHNEDELAAVLAHELGHIVTHQMAYEFSSIFKHQIGVTQFTDKKDFTEKFHRMLESKKTMNVVRRDDQDEADRVGAEILIRAGYRPEAMYEFYDRFTANKGKRGNWFSDAFGSSDEDSKRYRTMIKDLPQIPANCISKLDANSEKEYLSWRASIVAYDGQSRAEHLPGLISKHILEPPLQDQLHTLRFSPDGKYVLAQDNATIYVLTRDPFAVVFSIPAEEAFPARFTDDSTSITFYTPELRVEQWDIASKKPNAIHELHSAFGCMQTALSTDSHTLACIDGKQDLVLIDTATQDRIFEKKDVRSGRVDFGAYYSSISYQIEYVNLAFSPDGKYLLLSGKYGTMGVDVANKKEVPLAGPVKNALKYAFVFLDNQRIFGLNDRSGSEASVVHFPDGKVEKTVPFGAAIPSPVTNGDYVLMRPIRDYEVGVVDLNSGQIVRANKLPAMDVYEKFAVSELGSGEVGLFGATAAPLARVRLPRGHFAAVRTSATSTDFQWLAVSEENRAAVWNLATGQRIYNVKSFKGAYFGPDGAYVDFPKQEKTDHIIARLNLQQPGIGLANTLGPGTFYQRGPVVITWKKKDSAKKETDKDDKEPELGTERFNRYRYEGSNLRWRDVFVMPEENETLEVRDSRTGNMLWSRTFDKRVPHLDPNPKAGVIALSWRLYMPGAKAELDRLPSLEQKKASFKDGDYLIEVVDMMTGAVVGGTFIDTNDGAFKLDSILATRNWAAGTDSYGRALVYSLKTGECTGKIFGHPHDLATDSNELLVRKDSRHYTLYDATTMSEKKEFTFPFSTTMVGLSNKGDRVLAVTEDQITYLLSTQGDEKSTDVSAAK